ncbi:MAG: alpha/beta hydrolase [Chloroflexi bacterium]|nr:alpha/beta hydrolase [Chloroflexota bacterium]
MATAKINGIELFYEITGEGYPIVWSHEFAGDYRSWDPQVSFFSRLYQNVTYNNRGYPPSGVPTDPDAYSQDQSVDDLHGLMQHLGLKDAHVAGLSMGGNVALNFALKYPELCRSIVVAGCGAGTTNRERFERDVRQSVELMQTKGMDAFVDLYAAGPTRQPYLRKDPKGYQVFKEQFAAHSTLGSALTFQGVQLRRPPIYELKDKMNRLTVPTLVLIGDEDEPCVDPAVFMKREIPTAGLVVIPQSGHTINLEEPDAFNRAVLDFFRVVEAGKWPTRSLVTTELMPNRA